MSNGTLVWNEARDRGMEKWQRGQVEHGGDLYRKPTLDEAIDEAIDLIPYLYIHRQHVRRAVCLMRRGERRAFEYFGADSVAHEQRDPSRSRNTGRSVGHSPLDDVKRTRELVERNTQAVEHTDQRLASWIALPGLRAIERGLRNTTVDSSLLLLHAAIDAHLAQRLAERLPTRHGAHVSACQSARLATLQA